MRPRIDFTHGTPMNNSRTRSAQILTDAVEKTDQVQEELQDAVDSLSSANAVLSGPLPTAQVVSAIAGAVKQNLEAESKVQDAKEELENVKDLIQEAQIAQAAGDSTRNSGEGTASILGHLVSRPKQARQDEDSRP
jgi:cysteinyl-tRNA synthetase